MADPLKVKAGDTLKIPVKVTYADNATGAPVRIAGDLMPTVMGGQEEFWVSRELVEAAEHIPAPRIFKRGDWVWNIDKITKGLVVKVYPNGDIWVSWDTDEACPALHSPDFFELVEAPE